LPGYGKEKARKQQREADLGDPVLGSLGQNDRLVSLMEASTENDKVLFKQMGQAQLLNTQANKMNELAVQMKEAAAAWPLEHSSVHRHRVCSCPKTCLACCRVMIDVFIKAHLPCPSTPQPVTICIIASPSKY
jgi:hypothetical protein